MRSLVTFRSHPHSLLSLPHLLRVVFTLAHILLSSLLEPFLFLTSVSSITCFFFAFIRTEVSPRTMNSLKETEAAPGELSPACVCQMNHNILWPWNRWPEPALQAAKIDSLLQKSNWQDYPAFWKNKTSHVQAKIRVWGFWYIPSLKDGVLWGKFIQWKGQTFKKGRSEKPTMLILPFLSLFLIKNT